MLQSNSQSIGIFVERDEGGVFLCHFGRTASPTKNILKFIMALIERDSSLRILPHGMKQNIKLRIYESI